MDGVEFGFAENGDVRIHYATAGEGPLVVMIHGFPDFWYSWRDQMAGLMDSFQVVAIDQRGYNLSSQPEGVEAYSMDLLVSDVAAVVRHFGAERATIVGHDWGGVVAWNVAFEHPEMVERLVILNLPHPVTMSEAWDSDPEARAGTGYAQVFRDGSPSDPDVFFGYPMTPVTLSGWVTDAEARPMYVEAFGRSSFDGMLNYYKANYPEQTADGERVGGNIGAEDPPLVQAPTLIFHGLQDTALDSSGLNDSWDWIDADLTIVTVPEAGHFVQQDAAALVTETMRWWLLMRQ
jgi:pimeloyl-ACP methyl ester carboxylesterase